MNEPKTRKGEKTRRRILEASVRLIKERGFDRVTLSDMCRAAEVAPGTFYHYFSSNSDILWEILRVEGEELLAYHRKLRGPARERLKKLLDYQMDYYERKGKEVVAHIYQLEMTVGQGESRIEELLPLRALTARIIREGLAEEGKEGDPEEGAVSLVSLLLFYSILWIRDGSAAALKDHLGTHLEKAVEEVFRRPRLQEPPEPGI